jgi:hypothetical protein
VSTTFAPNTICSKIDRTFVWQGGFHRFVEEHVNLILRNVDVASIKVIVMAGVLVAGVWLAMAGTTQVTRGQLRPLG